MEVAVDGRADAIATGKKGHFPSPACHGVPVVFPAEFLAVWPSGPGT
ncbi:hypothetical protein [Caldinitratiruptor microaerophilus]|nr:hypothetical protein [Caldinitratiruptor microaerophilus]